MTKTTTKIPKLTMMTMTAAIMTKMLIRKTTTPLVNMTLFFMTVTLSHRGMSLDRWIF